MSDKFRTAYRRARQRIGEDAWSHLSDREQAEAVAKELRDLDAGRLGDTADDGKGDPDT